MKLNAVIYQYINYRKSLGEDFKSNASILKTLLRSFGPEAHLNEIKPEFINQFLTGKAFTCSWHNKYYCLSGFYRYAISRGYIENSPLPVVVPKQPPRFIPHIYNVKELRALLDACSKYQNRRKFIMPLMVRTLILCLYGTGLRLGEAIALTIADVDLDEEVLTVRETKFRKTRLVPVGKSLKQIFLQYTEWRKKKRCSQKSEAPFFVGRNGKAVNRCTVEIAFQVIREMAGVRRTDGARYQPRLHDLRHTFAVHRLTSWYRQGDDVQKLLPMLSVYLGHTYLASTSRYLTMTPALLEEASHRFEQYALKEDTHV